MGNSGGVARKTANWANTTLCNGGPREGRGSRCCCTRDLFLPPVSSTANFEAPMTRVHDAKHREGQIAEHDQTAIPRSATTGRAMSLVTKYFSRVGLHRQGNETRQTKRNHIYYLPMVYFRSNQTRSTKIPLSPSGSQ